MTLLPTIFVAIINAIIIKIDMVRIHSIVVTIIITICWCHRCVLRTLYSKTANTVLEHSVLGTQ